MQTLMLIFATLIFATQLTGSKLTYDDGIEDTILVIKSQYEDIKPLDVTLKEVNGFMVYAETSDLSVVDLTNYAAIGYRNGYPVFFAKNKSGQNIIVFQIKERKADAIRVQDKLSKLFGIPGLHIEYERGSIQQIVIIGKEILDSLNYKYKDKLKTSIIQCDNESQALKEAFTKLSHRDDVEINADTRQVLPKHEQKVEQPKEQIVVIGKVQVVNRVVTDKWLKKNYGGHVEKVPAIRKGKYKKASSYADQKEVVSESINCFDPVLEKRINQVDTLSQAFNILNDYAVITKEGKLLVNKRLYSEGDSFGSLKVLKLVYTKGLVVLAGNSQRKSGYVKAKK